MPSICQILTNRSNIGYNLTMVSKYSYKKITWVDLISPTVEEVEACAETYGIPDAVKEEILRPTPRGRVDLYDDVVYLVLHFPDISNFSCKSNNSECEVLDEEFNFVVTKDAVLTIHPRKSEVLNNMAEKFDSPIIDGMPMFKGSSHDFFFSLLVQLYRGATHQVSDFDDVLQSIKEDIFDKKEAKMVGRISTVNHYLLDVKQITRFHGDILNSLDTIGKDFFGHTFPLKSSSVFGEYNKMTALLESHREILADLRITNDSLLQTSNNDAIRILTIITVIMLPLTLVTGFFGMNTFDGVEIIQGYDSIAFIALSMFVIAFSMYIYFKSKKWL